jgi:hypothetical protein
MIRNKKNKSSFFFFPEIDTEEEFAGHVLVVDKDEPRTSSTSQNPSNEHSNPPLSKLKVIRAQ